MEREPHYRYTWFITDSLDMWVIVRRDGCLIGSYGVRTIAGGRVAVNAPGLSGVSFRSEYSLKHALSRINHEYEKRIKNVLCSAV